MPSRKAASGTDDLPGLQVSQDMVFQRRTWVVQRTGWALFLLLILAALAGLFSRGPLSRATASDPGGTIAVEYDRFLRYDSPSELVLRLGPEAAGGGPATVLLGGRLASGLEIERIRPEPERMTAAADGLRFEFDVAEPGGGAEIRFTVRPQQLGTLTGEIGIDGREPARLDPFVYP